MCGVDQGPATKVKQSRVYPALHLGAVVDSVVGGVDPARADRAMPDRDVSEQPPDRPRRQHACEVPIWSQHSHNTVTSQSQHSHSTRRQHACYVPIRAQHRRKRTDEYELYTRFERRSRSQGMARRLQQWRERAGEKRRKMMSKSMYTVAPTPGTARALKPIYGQSISQMTYR